MSRKARGHIAGLPLPAWLIALSIVPLLGGAVRLLQVASGDAPAPEDLRFSVAPLPATLHIAAATFHCLAGAGHHGRAETIARSELKVPRKLTRSATSASVSSIGARSSCLAGPPPACRCVSSECPTAACGAAT